MTLIPNWYLAFYSENATITTYNTSNELDHSEPWKKNAANDPTAIAVTHIIDFHRKQTHRRARHRSKGERRKKDLPVDRKQELYLVGGGSATLP
jgi:hypothetical protein